MAHSHPGQDLARPLLKQGREILAMSLASYEELRRAREAKLRWSLSTWKSLKLHMQDDRAAAEFYRAGSGTSPLGEPTLEFEARQFRRALEGQVGVLEAILARVG